jgi:hypothetical protein
MANPQDAGTFEDWVTDRIPFNIIPPRAAAQDTGTFEDWITDRMHFNVYAEAAGRTTYNTDIRPLGVWQGVSRMVNIQG